MIEKLQEKLLTEYERFKNDILQKDKEYIFENAYKITTRDDIVNFAGFINIKDHNIIKLLKLDNLLDVIYGQYMGSDDPYLDDEVLKNIINEILADEV